MNDPWFRLHANIGDRNVVARLMRFANLDQARAVGYLAMFWGKLSQHGSNGDISETTDVQIEQWASWRGKRGVFARFVREEHSTDGVINEYDDYCSVLETLRARDRARKAIKNPPRKRKDNSAGIPAESKRKANRNSEGNSAGNPKEFRGNSASTIRNEDDTKEQKQTPTPSGRTRGKPAPWMGEINRVWGDVFPDAKAPTGAARMLSPIVDRFGIERVAAELGVYLRATQPQFLSVPKFCATFGGASAEAKAQSPTTYAAKLIRFYVDNGFTQSLPLDQYDARIDELAAEHKVKDPERVKRELRAVAPWMTLQGMRAGESGRYEERVAKRLQEAKTAA